MLQFIIMDNTPWAKSIWQNFMEGGREFGWRQDADGPPCDTSRRLRNPMGTLGSTSTTIWGKVSFERYSVGKKGIFGFIHIKFSVFLAYSKYLYIVRKMRVYPQFLIDSWCLCYR